MDAASPMTSRQTLPNDVRNWPIVFISEPDATQLKLTGYWQQFYNGDGFHQTTTYIHDMGIGSHGCVNLLPVDARKYYSTLKYGTKVHLYGRRPGT